MSERFVDDRRSLYDFGNLFAVECPRCKKRARVEAEGRPLRATAASLTCIHCGYSDRRQLDGHALPTVSDSGDVLDPGTVHVRAAVDWFFHRPLWLRTSCAGNELWAYNPDHLEHLRSYVSADLRERASAHSVVGRLPKWMTSGKNRSEVLRCVACLERRAQQDV